MEESRQLFRIEQEGNSQWKQTLETLENLVDDLRSEMTTWKGNKPREKPHLHEECTPQTQRKVLGCCPVQTNSTHDALHQATSSIGQGRVSISRDKDEQPGANRKRDSAKAQKNMKRLKQGSKDEFGRQKPGIKYYP
ncbi:hypothetical protein JTB14_030334 [Gonioctena quinquepunctata]|nr:hypothetical protein JTB14_030334 [Gonioctena quinquepunctata]